MKEEILTRWGELGLRVTAGRVRFDPVLLDVSEIAENGELAFTWARIPCRYRRGPATRLRVLTEQGWQDCPDRSFTRQGVQALEATLRFDEA